MKVNNEFRIAQEKIIKGLPAANHEKISFQDVFTARQLKLTREELQSYLIYIDEVGERLRRSRSFQDLARYKRLIKHFIQIAVDSGLALEKHPSQNRLLQLIETIDQKLLELTDEVFYKEKDNLRLLALIGEIKGLLINLYI